MHKSQHREKYNDNPTGVKKSRGAGGDGRDSRSQGHREAPQRQPDRDRERLPPPPPALDNQRSGTNGKPASRSVSPPARGQQQGPSQRTPPGKAAVKPARTINTLNNPMLAALLKQSQAVLKANAATASAVAAAAASPVRPSLPSEDDPEEGGGDREAGEISLGGSDSSGKRRRHAPIVWDPSVPVRPSKRNGNSAGVVGAPVSAAVRAAQELDDFRSRTGHDDEGYDPDGSPMLKRSPSHSDASDGSDSEQKGPSQGRRRQHEGSEVEDDEGHDREDHTAAGAKRPRNGVSTGAQASRWLDESHEEQEAAADLNLREGSSRDGVAPSSRGANGGRVTENVVPGASDDSRSSLDSEDESDREDEDERENATTSAPAVSECRDISLYEKMNRIEEGTYGVVYKARNLKTGEVCALKRLKMEKESNGFPVTSVREINILLKLQHPNIVKVHEVVMGRPGRGDNDIFMVMEYIENDLKKLMSSKSTMSRSFSVAEVKCLMLQLLSGVAYLHDNWVLHRDLKTSNILYSNRGELKICDLGLARQYGSPLRPYTQPVVTLWYRAPELLLGIRRYSTPIDIWSVGAIMGELLTGKPLFPGQSELAQLNEIISVMGTPTVEVWPGLTALPHYGKSQFRQLPSTLRQRFTSAFGGASATLTEAGLDLMQSMLDYDPERRITAQEALEHRWFKESPFPQKQALMPRFNTPKEGGNATRHAAAATGAGLLASPM